MEKISCENINTNITTDLQSVPSEALSHSPQWHRLIPNSTLDLPLSIFSAAFHLESQDIDRYR